MTIYLKKISHMTEETRERTGVEKVFGLEAPKSLMKVSERIEIIVKCRR